MTAGPLPGHDLWCDLGNSRLKWAQVDAEGQWLDLAPLAAEEGETATLASWPTHLDLGGATAWVSSVASPARRADLVQKLQESGAAKVVVHPDPGLEMRIRHPETAGRDRLYAARGAWHLVGQREAICVDVGTAMTVDAVGPGSHGPAFLGGAIAPGPELLARSLQQGGAQLWHVDPEGPVPALGRETKDALAAGIVVGLEGAAQRLVQRIAGELGWEAPAIVLTGGAAPWVRPALRELGWALVTEPRLVLLGLRQAAESGGCEA